MGVSLDLRKAWKHHRHGDLLVVLTWVNDERSLVLMPALRRGTGWYIVQESAAFKWGIDHPDPAISRPAMTHAIGQAEIACQMLDMEPSRENKARIMAIVSSWMPDLCRMPSAPPDPYALNGATFGEATLRADGEVVSGEEIRVLDSGVAYG